VRGEWREAVIENEILLGLGLLCLVAAVLATISIRFGLPTLVGFLVLGMVLGSNSPLGLDYSDADLTRQVATVCLVAILWDGGINTRWRRMAPILRPAILLATLGVLVSALITGLAAWPLLELDPLEGLLVGAVVASTDAAAVFATLHHVAIKQRLQSLLEAESGLNDPMAIALALGLTAW
jgi:cell volume regulation protein A